MKILFTSDLHGTDSLYAQLEALVAVEQPGLLIFGGDMHNDGDAADPVGTQCAFVRTQLARWLKRMRDSVEGLEIGAILGNHDWECTRTALDELVADKLLTIFDDQVRTLCGIHFVGYWRTPPTPFWLKDFERLDRAGDPLPEGEAIVWDAEQQRGLVRDCAGLFTERQTIEEELDAVAVPPAPWIFLSHAPPYGSALDWLPQLDHPIGSRAVRTFIERTQPTIALHGHVHESPEVTGKYLDMIGGTVCINGGQSHERLHAVVFDSDRPRETIRHTVYG